MRQARAPAHAAAQAASLASSTLKKFTPVTLPPGRLRLATRPDLTGSAPTAKTIGIVAVAALAASAAALPSGDDHGDLPANQIGRQRRQADRFDCPPSDIRSRRSGLRQSRLPSGPGWNARQHGTCEGQPADAPLRKPITGIAGCCARAATGHAAAAPPSSVMNSRRCHSITSSARASSVGGTSRPSAFAVLRLITSSNLVGFCTGRSAGFSPLRMRSTYEAERRTLSTLSGP